MKNKFVYVKYFVVVCGMETYNLKLQPETIETVTKIAEYEGRTVSNMARRIFEYGLAEYQVQQEKLDKLKQEKGIKI